MEREHENALECIRIYVKSWSSVTLCTSRITLLTGTSNKVYALENILQIIPEKIIYRVFGNNKVTDKTRECRIFSHLSSLDIAPKFYFASDKVRLEEFLEDYITLTSKDFYDPYMIQQVCSSFKSLHSVDMSEVLRGEGLIIDNNLEKWKKLALTKIPEFETIENYEEIMEILGEETWNMYNDVIPRDSPVIFSHLDISPLNLMHNPIARKLCLIDYEFSGYYYRATDFGLMFSEMTFNYLTDKPPFFEYFPENIPSDELIKEYTISYGEGAALWVEIKLVFIASNYYWAVWCLAMAEFPTEGFDFISNALLRIKLFKSAYQDFKANNGRIYLHQLADKLFC